MRYNTSFRTIDYYNYSNILFYFVLGLSIFGCIIICSSTAHTDFGGILLFKQIFCIILGILVCKALSFINYNFFKKITYPILLISFLLLISVFFFPARNGAHRWIQLPFFGNFQPSEFAKFSIVLFVAYYLDLHRSKIINYKKELWILLGIVLSFCFLIMLQPDLGQPFIILIVLMIILFSISIKKEFFLIIIVGFFLIMLLGIISKPYRIQRLKVLLNPWEYKTKEGYQIIQSYLALSRGHISGVGLGNGIFKEYYLPEAHTDFIFCMVGEEFGFLGSVGIILSYAILCFLGLAASYKSYVNERGFYGSVLILGLTLNIVVQAYISIAMTCGILPTKGVGLPFISYGGSSILVNFLSVGVMLSVLKNIKK